MYCIEKILKVDPKSRLSLEEILSHSFMKLADETIKIEAIVEEFEKQFGIKLDKRKMDLEEPIRGLGMARVPIHLHPEVVATISVQIKEK